MRTGIMPAMSEKTTPLGIKVVVVLVAIGLASGYVVFRNQAAKPSEAPIKDAPKISETKPEAAEEEEPPLGSPIIMSSSKSGAIASPEMSEELRRALMSSSKSGPVIPPQTFELPKQEEKEEKPIRPRTILPGSKSIQLVEPAPIPVKPKETE